MAEREWWLYVLECEGGSLYTGIAVDVARRYARHCAGVAAAYTRMRPPLRVVGAIRAGSRSDALKLEYAFKRLGAAEKRARALAMGLPVDLGNIAAHRGTRRRATRLRSA